MSTGLEQAGNHGRAAVDCRQPQRGRAERVGDVDVRSGIDEQLGRVEIVVVGRPLERRSSVALGFVNIGARREQVACGLEVTRSHRLDDRGPRLCVNGDRSCENAGECGDQRQRSSTSHIHDVQCYGARSRVDKRVSAGANWNRFGFWPSDILGLVVHVSIPVEVVLPWNGDARSSGARLRS